MMKLKGKFSKNASRNKARDHRILGMLSASERRDFQVGPNDLPANRQPEWASLVYRSR